MQILYCRMCTYTRIVFKTDPGAVHFPTRTCLPTHGISCLMLSVNISEQRMAEVLAKEAGGEEEARGAPVSAGPCSLLAWPLANLFSLFLFFS